MSVWVLSHGMDLKSNGKVVGTLIFVPFLHGDLQGGHYCRRQGDIDDYLSPPIACGRPPNTMKASQ